jgi:serine/threonine-protein kinase
MTLCDGCGGATFGSGASWGLDGNIILGGFTTGLLRVSAAGGTPQVLTTTDAKKGEVNHRWPHVLPGGEAVLFTAGRGGSFDDARISVLSLKSGEQRVLVEGGSHARYVPTGPGADGRGTGHIVYWRNASLLAVPFDLRALQVAGSPVPILEGVLGFPPQGFADYSFSDAGTLVFAPGGAEASTASLVWVDRQGQAQPLPAPPRSYLSPRLSPDGRRVAVAIGGLAQADVWVYELERGALTRLTFQGSNAFPGWMPDGSRITFYSVAPDKKQSLASVPADGSRAPEILAAVSDVVAYLSWSPDSKLLAFAKGPAASRDIFFLPAQGDRKEKPFLQTPPSEYAPEFSPDGRWIAYTSHESGRPEVYVRPAPSAAGAAPGDGKWQISTDSGQYPRWSRSGRELFYRNLEKVMAVEIDPGPAFRARTPKVLFEGRYLPTVGSWDVSADGKRFLMIKGAGEQESGPGQVHVVFEWFEEIRRRVRAGG